MEILNHHVYGRITQQARGPRPRPSFLCEALMGHHGFPDVRQAIVYIATVFTDCTCTEIAIQKNEL